MKIVYCIPDCSYSGGTERTLSLQANYFAENGHEVHIVTTEKPYKAYNSYVFSDKIKFHNLSINYKEVDNLTSLSGIISKIKKNQVHFKKLTTLLTAIKSDFTITLYGHELSFLYKIKDGSKKIIEFHFSRYYKKIECSNNTSLLKKWFVFLKEWRKRYFIHNYDAFVVLTQEDAINWKKYKKTYVIPNAIPFVHIHTSNCQNKKIISVGRLTFQKGYDMLIEAWNMIANKYPEWEINIYGSGEEYSKLISKIEKYNLSNSLKIYPPVNDIKSKYIESAIYVMSSRYEGLPMVLIEAMSCGLPCISFACPCGPSEIIKNGDNGYIVPERNIRALADKMQILIENEKKRKEMGRRAKQEIACYSKEHVMSLWSNLFYSLLQK